MKYFQPDTATNPLSTADKGIKKDFANILRGAAMCLPKAKFRSVSAVILAAVLVPNIALADVKVEMHKLTDTGVGAELGTVTLTENEYGVVFTPELENLSPGLHGFHVHQNASCEPQKKDGKIVAGGAAGGHMDTKSTEHHGTPWGDGHVGDLPALFVSTDGKAETPVLAPRLTLKMLNKHALMIHENGDNYADEPKPLGGGGSRVACGVIESD